MAASTAGNDGALDVVLLDVAVVWRPDHRGNPPTNLAVTPLEPPLARRIGNGTCRLHVWLSYDQTM
jgi:hypothetical protein